MSGPLDPARERALHARELIERVLLLLPDFPARADRAGLEAAINRLLASLGPWAEPDRSPPDPLQLADANLAQLLDLRAALEAIPETRPAVRKARRAARGAEQLLRACRSQLIDQLVAGQDRALRREAARGPAGEAPSRPAPQPFRASAGVPSLHVLARGPLSPLLDLGPGDDEDDDDAEDAPPDPLDRSPDEERYERLLAWIEGHPFGQPDPDEGRADLERLARGCMEDIAILGSLRRTRDEEPWAAAASFEQRLLDNLDALLALGKGGPEQDRDPGIFEQLGRYSTEQSPDPGRTFARAFVLGCVDGEDTLRALVLALRRSHPYTLASQEEALSLAPHPGIPEAMRRLLDGDDPALGRLGLEVLRFRRAVPFGSVVQNLRHPDVAMAEGAARCLAVAAERAAAIQALEALLDDDLEDRLLLAVAESLLVLGSTRGLDSLRRALGEEAGGEGLGSDALILGAIRLIALAGSAGDAELLGAAVRRRPSAAGHLGWFGHVGLVPLLLSLLPPVPTIASRAFGELVGDALARILGPLLPDPRSDPGAAQAAWEAARDRFAPDRKHRFGRPFTVLASLDELDDDGSPAAARASCALEVALAGGPEALVETADWIARQRVELRRVRQLLAAPGAPIVPGEWPGQWLGPRRR